MIEIEGVSKWYGKTLAVDQLSLHIPRGELFAFLGPNGAGKTTTIKMLCGLSQPSEGSLSLGGHSLTDEPKEAKSLLGYIPDRPYLYEKLTAWEFLGFVADLYKVPREAFAERAEQWLRTFSLWDKRNELIESYSHGMKQKVVFASALVHAPQVLVIDEPMVGLDPASVRLVKDLLKEQSRQGTTVFLSTHTLSVAEELADRIGIIHKGKLIALGSLNQLREQARSDQMNLETSFLRLTGNGAEQPSENLNGGMLCSPNSVSQG